MYKIVVKYSRKMRMYKAHLEDQFGFVGGDYYAPTRDRAIFLVGKEYGSNPQKFARPIDWYVKSMKLAEA